MNIPSHSLRRTSFNGGNTPRSKPYAETGGGTAGTFNTTPGETPNLLTSSGTFNTVWRVQPLVEEGTRSKGGWGGGAPGGS